MASLFSVFKNHLFLSLYQVIRNIKQGQAYTPQELHKALYGSMSFHPDIEKAIAAITALFFTTKNGFVTLKVPFSLPDLPPTHIEKEWLKTVITDSTCQPFLSADLQQKLENILQDIPALPLPEIFSRETLQEPTRTGLIRYWQALLNKQPVCLSFTDFRLDLKGQPFRLDYNAKKKTFSYLVYTEQQMFQRFNTAAIKEIIPLSSSPSGENLTEKYEKYLASCKTSLTLSLSPKWNAVERCFLLFSSYEKEAVYDEDTDRYKLTIYFYRFDTDEVLDDVFSLGSAVTLVSPENLRQKIIQRLQAAYQWYQEDTEGLTDI